MANLEAGWDLTWWKFESNMKLTVFTYSLIILFIIRVLAPKSIQLGLQKETKNK